VVSADPILAHFWRVALAIDDLETATDSTTLESLLGAIALGKGQHDMGCLILDFDKSERLEILRRYRGRSRVVQRRQSAA
jgi:hypothetical protein